MASSGPGHPWVTPQVPLAGEGAASAFSGIGIGLSIAGALNGAIGAYFDVLAQKNQAKSAALSAEFESTLAAMDAQAAEQEAQSILQSGQEEIGRLTMSAGAQRAARRASMAAAGIDLGPGSATEVQASADIITALDRYSISRNAARAAAASRVRGTNASTRSLLGMVSAGNLRGTAASLNPGLAAAGSLLESGARYGSAWAASNRG